jgi:hypothetical protein
LDVGAKVNLLGKPDCSYIRKIESKTLKILRVLKAGIYYAQLGQ